MIPFPSAPSNVLRFLSELYPNVFDHVTKESSIEVMQILRSHIQRTLRMSVTNLYLEYQEFAGFKFCYTYSRQNLHFSEQPTLKDIYPGLNSRTQPYYSSFHSCGQSAVSTVLLALSQCYPQFVIHYPAKPYFETPLALKLLNKGIEVIEGEELVLVDSTYFEPDHMPELVESLDRFRVVIIDTSLWGWSDPLLQKLIDAIVGKKDIFLVRSHLKLDCLGGEYATLGSIVYLPATASTKKYSDEIVSHIQTASSSIGGCPAIDQLYPFYKNNIFHDLTIKRITEIQSSIDRIVPKVAPLIDRTHITLELPYHRLFYLLRFKSSDPELKKHVLKFIRLDSGAVALVDSYGFDFPSVLVSALRNETDCFLIRLNGHNLGERVDEEVVETHKKIIFVANSCAIPKN